MEANKHRIQDIPKHSFKNYYYPDIDCLPGSAWHDWAKCGAIYAHKHGVEEAKSLAERWAALGNSGAGASYQSRLQAFHAGINNSHKLKRLNSVKDE